MVETAWVLERAYGLCAGDIAAAIERTLQADVLVVENEQEVFTAMIALKEGRRLLRRCPHRGVGRQGGLFPHSDLRPEGAPASRIRAAVSPLASR